MTSLWAMVVDGPCVGSYDIRRATKRMVFTVDRVSGERFVLDEDGDSIEPTEDAYVYEATSGGFVHGRGPGLPARTVSFEYRGTLERDTGVFVPATEAELAEARQVGRDYLIAIARDINEPPRRRSPRLTEKPTAEAIQEALF